MLGRVNCSGSNFQTILGAWPMKSSWHCQIDTFKSAIWQGQILKTSNIAALSEQGKKLGRVNCSGSNFQTRLVALPIKSSWWPTLHNWKKWQCSSFNSAREKNLGRANIPNRKLSHDEKIGCPHIKKKEQEWMCPKVFTFAIHVSPLLKRTMDLWFHNKDDDEYEQNVLDDRLTTFAVIHHVGICVRNL